MIFYFSGTGNSLYVAQTIAKDLDEKLISISEELSSESDFVYTLKQTERIGFVFPVYAWGLPKIVSMFINKMSFKNYESNFVFFAATCGDDIGCTRRLFEKEIRKKSLMLNSAYSIVMPDCYISLPGFDVDTTEVRSKKLAEAPLILRYVVKEIKERRRGIFRLKPGPYAWAKSYILRPLFNAFLMSDKPFLSTDKCNGCGKCERVCPLHNIDCSDKRPKWKGNCTGCLACYHNCPTNAVQYGKRTKGKGQYLFSWYKP